MDGATLSVISACTALVASIAGPMVTLTVAKRQYSATVLSANRQRWIESLRDSIADLMAQVVAIMVVKQARKDSWETNMGAAASDPDLLKRIERLAQVHWKIRLLLSGYKPEQIELADVIESLIESLKREQVAPAAVKESVDKITVIARSILGHEWERVKKGV